MRIVEIPVALGLLCAPAALFAQDAAAPAAKSPYVSVLGTIGKADAAAKVLTVKTDKGEETTIKFDDKTVFMKVAAGETDMKKAEPAGAADAVAGDKVVARVLTADPTGKPARTVYVMKQEDLAAHQQKSRDEWKSAQTGIVASIDGKEIKITVRAMNPTAPKEIAVDISGKVDFRQYNPDAGAYESGAVGSVKVGDQLLVLGPKSADGTSIKADRVGFGSFKTLGVVVKSIDVAGNQIIGTEAASKKPITIALRGDTSLKKFDDAAALMVARMLNPTFQQAGGRGGRGGGAPGGMPGAGGGAPGGGAPGGEGRGGAPQGAGPGGMPPGGPGGRGGFGGGRGRGGMDIGKMIEAQPAIKLADLKAGDALIVTGATGKDAAKLTATALVAGVEPILRAAPSNGADPLAGSWNMGGGGGGGEGN